MVNMRELWEPIVLSSAGVFVASAVIWMVAGYHKKDLVGVKDEEAMRKAIKAQDLAPNQYAIPYSADQKDRMTPEFQQKMKDGPLAIITIRKAGMPDMKRMLGAWMLHLLVLNAFIAYIAGRVGSHGIPFLPVFRTVGTIALIGFAGALPVQSIFWGKPVRATALDMFDALINALITGAIYGWLWPQ